MATYFNAAYSSTDIRQAKLYTKDEVLSSPYYSPEGRGFTVYDGTSEKYPFCSTLDIEGLVKVDKYYTQNNETVFIYEGIPVTTTEIVDVYTENVSTQKTYNNSHGLGYLISVYGGNGTDGSVGSGGERGDAYQGAGSTFNGDGGKGGSGGDNGNSITLRTNITYPIRAGGGYAGGGGGGGAGGLAGTSSSPNGYTNGGVGGDGGSGTRGENRYVIHYGDFSIDEIEVTVNGHSIQTDGENGTGYETYKESYSKYYGGAGGMSGNGASGGSRNSGPSASGGNGASASDTFGGFGGTKGSYGNTSTYTQGAVVISKYKVEGIR